MAQPPDRGPGEQAPHCRRPRAWLPQTVTRHSASRTIEELILLAPRSRSANVIGTSATRKPLR